MDTFQKVWDFLNGKKTWIGAGFLIVGYGGPYVGIPQDVCDALVRIGEFLGGVGILHKFYKGGEKKGFNAGVQSCEVEPNETGPKVP